MLPMAAIARIQSTAQLLKGEAAAFFGALVLRAA
jgi:hypothetical protein